MKEHDAHIRDQLTKQGSAGHWHDLKEAHQTMIRSMQHERMVHLAVTLAFGLFLLISVAILLLKPSRPVFFLMAVLLLVFIFYVMHYYFMENTIQQWYRLLNEITDKEKAAGS
ncbi:hypothetical protein JW948_01095 [bacterium]|nr:hypothetical protein [bacterium]